MIDITGPKPHESDIRKRMNHLKKSFPSISFVQFAGACLCLFLYAFFSPEVFAQEPEINMPEVRPDTISEQFSLAPRPAFSFSDSLENARMLKDSIRNEKRKQFSYVDTTPFKDSLSIYYWRISENLGEFRPANPDTILTGFYGRTYVDGMGTSMSYLGNLGTPALSRIFSERRPLSNFMFTDAYSIYNREPYNFNFINTRVPYSNLAYETEGGGDTQNQRLRGGISVNLSKKLNLGFDINYLYTHGKYISQSASHIDLVLYSSYFSDRYRYHLFYNNRNDINYENGGIKDDRFVTSPEVFDPANKIQTTDIPTRFTDTWNRIKGSRFFYTHRYNLGFEKETGEVDEEGEDKTQFITVGSIIHTADLYVQKHKFISNDLGLDSLYTNHYLATNTNDTTTAWNLKNTVGISLREGFSKWAKFDLTAYAAFDYRQYLLMERFNLMEDADSHAWKEVQTATYVGGELSNSSGKLLRYNAQGEFGVLGENLGDVSASGTIETRIPVLGDTASFKAKTYFKNLSPSFYEKHYHSKYFWWDNNDFSQTQRLYIGGELDIPHTRTQLSAGVENLTNYINFNEQALPQQHSESIQLITARLDQNFKLGVLHWDNQIVYQKSADETVIPVPDFCLYSNLYLDFPVVKVLKVQLGADVHYFTKYYSPTYEPATQQFHTQSDTQIGNYPFVNTYLNCRLYKVRFFLNFYNVASSFINGPAYFSLPHYPVSPMAFKFGLSIDFSN